MTKSKKTSAAKPKRKKESAATAAPSPAMTSTTVVDDVAGHLDLSWGKGWLGSVIFYIAIAFSIFQIVTSFGIPLDKDFFATIPKLDLLFLIRGGLLVWLAYLAYLAYHRHFTFTHGLGFLAVFGSVELVAHFAGGMPSVVVRAIHVGFLTLLGAAMIANSIRNGPLKIAVWIMGIAGFLIGLYQWLFYLPLIDRSGFLTEVDLAVGTLSLGILFFLIQRIMGNAIAVVCGAALAYALFGQHLPAPFNHRGYSYDQVIEHMAFNTEGIYGVPTLVSATYIFLFIMFGSFMERAGVIRFFNELSMAVFGGAQGGPGKVCVASSALMGTVSGSGIANVVASGQFTIPLMKRSGFPAAYAGGVEATSSMGGQIMPPVMGAVAFIMAETIDRPYSDIVQAAIIPALLYFGACFWSVHLEAGRRGLKGLPRDQLPSAWDEIRNNWYLILPLVVLVYLLFAGYTPLFAGAVGLSLTVLLLLGITLAGGMRETGIRILFWTALGILAAISLWMSVVFVLVLLAALVVWSAFQQRGREALLACREAMADGARQALSVGLACAIIGIVIGTMTLTGLGTIVGTWMISVGRESLFLALVLTMIFSLILGMGIPTIPNYIITSSLAAPILLKLDVPLIVSHMFVFYFGIMADLTPPVALAAFAAAPMARVSGFSIAMKAVLIALPGFIVPYMAVYDPALMLQPVAGVTGTAYSFAVAYVCIKAALAVALWGVTAVGYLFGPVSWWERSWTFVAAAFLVVAAPLTDEIGFALGIAFLAYHYWVTRRGAAVKTKAA
jgi:TRAP transporter 4TM/12TM fusion protein